MKMPSLKNCKTPEDYQYLLECMTDESMVVAHYETDNFTYSSLKSYEIEGDLEDGELTSGQMLFAITHKETGTLSFVLARGNSGFSESVMNNDEKQAFKVQPKMLGALAKRFPDSNASHVLATMVDNYGRLYNSGEVDLALVDAGNLTGVSSDFIDTLDEKIKSIVSFGFDIEVPLADMTPMLVLNKYSSGVNELINKSNIDNEAFIKLFQKSKNNLLTFIDSAISNSIKTTILDKLPPDARYDAENMIQPYLSDAGTLARHMPEQTIKMGNLPPEEFRNWMQLYKIVDKNIPAWKILRTEPSIINCMREGTSLKSALSDSFPLANVSKASQRKFFNNLVSLSSDMSSNYRRNRLFYSKELTDPSHRTIMTEKGEQYISRGCCAGMSVDQVIYCAAVAATFPESTFATRRTHDKFDFYRLEAATARFFGREAMRRSASLSKIKSKMFSDSLGWVHRLDRLSNDAIERSLMDLSRILRSSFIGPIVGHLDSLYEKNKIIYQPRIDFHNDISLVKNYNVSKLLDLSEEAHRAHLRIVRLKPPENDVVWDPAIEENYVKGDLTIVPIHSLVSMHEEGRAMNHCVGSYAADAIRGETFIFGVRNGDKRISTFEIQRGDFGVEWSLEQHQAWHNQEPSTDASEAVESFMEDINNRRLAFNKNTGIEDDPSRRLDEIAMEELETGIAFRDREVIYHVIDELKVLMPHFEFEYLLEMPREPVFKQELDRLKEDYRRWHLSQGMQFSD